ncbi:MAG: PAS-domain containing protein [Alphaproteobacteria bacterium]|nr:PAS-domain containing protein [Alphaproteobacteria bacterium]
MGLIRLLSPQRLGTRIILAVGAIFVLLAALILGNELLDFSEGIRIRNRMTHGLSDILLIALGIFSMMGAVALVMRRPLAALDEATRFTEDLAELRGRYLDYRVGAPVEILRLQTAINHASARLADQERQLLESRKAQADAWAAAENLERLSREAIESISEGFVLFDHDMRLVLCNDTYRQAYPLIADLLVPGANFIDILRKAATRGQFVDDTEHMDEWVRERIARHLGHTDPVVCRLTSDRWYVISERATPSGGVVKLLTDITEIKRQEEHLRQSHKMEALGQLASGLAHEFNNVLTAVGGFAEMGRRDPSNAARAELCFVEIGKAAERATDLTGQLLSFSRNQPTETRVVDVGQAVWDLESFLRPLLGERVTLSIAPHDDGLLASINPSQLAQAVVNLVINARDAMSSVGAISIRTEPVSLSEPEAQLLSVTAGRYVAIRVTDTGTGIDDELKKRIFEPFFTTKQAGEGTGLGLAMVYGFATGAGGTVHLESTLGQGSTFSIFLPITTKPLRHRHSEPGDLPMLATDATILVAEDDPAVLDYLKHLLFDLGYRVLAAPGGTEALRLASENRPNLALCDVAMPDMSGPEVIRHLKESQRGIKAVLMSGYPFPTMEPGLADACIDKPLDPVELAEILARLLAEEED